MAEYVLQEYMAKLKKRSPETNDKTDKYTSPATVQSVGNATQTEEDIMGQGVLTEAEDKATQTDWLWLDKVKVNEEWDNDRRADGGHIQQDNKSFFYYAKDIP